MFTKEIDNAIMNKILHLNKVGLLEGDMGLCIYAFIIGKKRNDKNMIQYAQNLLEKILDYSSRIRNLNLGNGITGIALGISFLIKKGYVEGDVNDILKSVDNFVYRKTTIAFSKDMAVDYVLDVLIYEICRWKDIKDEKLKILKEKHIGELINYMYINRPSTFYTEPFPFSLKSAVCLFLMVSATSYDWGIEKVRISRILGEMKLTLFAQRPILNANRLWLAVASNFVYKKVQDLDWKAYSDSLLEKLDMELIFSQELRDKSLFPSNGIIAIWLVLYFYNEYLQMPYIKVENQVFVDKILKSSIWEKYSKDLSFLEANYSLDGYCGLKLFLDYLNTDDYEV